MRHKLCLDVVSEAPPERAASTHVRRGNSQNLIRKKKDSYVAPQKNLFTTKKKLIFVENPLGLFVSCI